MKAQWFRLVASWAAIATLLNSGCGAAPSSLPLPAAPPSTAAQTLLATPVPSTSTSGQGALATAAPTEGEFALNLTPLPTQTALPTLAIPTESIFAGTFEVWDGLPTYPADSQPGFYFRLRFDPGVWARTTDQYGAPSLAHRAISGCIVAPTVGRGLPQNGTVQHDLRRINGIGFQVNTVSVNGVLQFVTYIGGDGVISTGFQVTFADQSGQCLSDAEAVLGALKAVPVAEATPVAAP